LNLTEVLNLLMVILTLLGLILEVVRLTVEVMDKNSQKKNDDNKKD
jgi:division protein CdvB (Snf7/Vps24/ESCRT-III family)